MLSPPRVEGGDQRLDEGRYSFITDIPGNGMFGFEDLERRSLVSRSAVSVTHADPDEATAILKEKDPDLKSIVVFPNDVFNVMYNDCVIVPTPRYDFEYMDCPLLLHDSLLREKKRARALSIAIRDAWLELRSNGAELDRVLDLMFEDHGFARFLSRSTGLHEITFEGVPAVSPH